MESYQITGAQRESIEGMAVELGTSNGGVIGRAMSLYQTCVKEELAGNQIGIFDSDYNLKKLVVGITPGENN